MKTKDKALFFFLPPGGIKSPSPAFSVLKSHLNKFDFAVEVKYLNLILNNVFINSGLFSNNNSDVNNNLLQLMPFIKRLLILEEDIEVHEKLKFYLLKIATDSIVADSFSHDNIIKYIEREIFKLLENEINKISHENILFMVLPQDTIN